MKFKSIIYQYCSVALLSIFSGLWYPLAYAEEVELDTGVIRVICGRDNGGFIDEVYLDSNNDGVYSADERVVLRPEEQAGLFVSYTLLNDGASREGVAVGSEVKAAVKVKEARLENLDAVIKGLLDFGVYGASPFEVRIRGTRKSAVLTADLSFEPLKKYNNLLLREASLRIYGVFDKREPQPRIRRMSTGEFRNTPRPGSEYQYITWQYGGHLVESPWHWREWVSWSENTGPQTIREGHTPPQDMTFFMLDNFHGMQAALRDPANASPVELGGSGYPSVLSIYAWSPRVRGLDLYDGAPDRFYMNEAAIHFFRTDLGNYAKDEDHYKKRMNMVVEDSKKELLSIAKPVISNLKYRRIPEYLYNERIDQISKMKSRGWADNTASTDTAFSPVMKSDDLPYGKNWTKVVLDVPAEVAGKNIPAAGGLPFPKGELDSVEHIKLIDSDGNEVACQVDRLAMWPDGSVKWALLTAFVEINPDKKPEFKVIYGPEVLRMARIAKKTEIQQSAKDMIVDNGVIRFTINRGGSGFFDSLWFDRNGDGIYTENERVFSGEEDTRRNRMDLAAFDKSGDYGPYMYHSDTAESEQSDALVEAIEVERQGPLVAHILVKGRYHYKKLGRERKEYENKGNEFWVRFTVYSGQPYIEIKHSYVFEGNPDLEMIRDLSLSARPNLGNNWVFTAAIDDRAHQILLPESGSSAGVFQDNPYSSELWLSEGSGKNEEINYVGLKGNGWTDISDGSWGVTFGVRHMREMYAKGLSVNNGSMVIALWPDRARYLDTRRYSRQFVSGESMSYGQGIAQGVSRSHDAFFYFHNGGAKEAGSEAVANCLLRAIFIKAYPEWYARTEAAGIFKVFDMENNGQWEKIMQDGLEYFLYNQKLWAWYGIYDFGDFQQRPTWDGQWQSLNGRWGWVNNEALVDMWIYEQFFRTGKREYLDAALALSRHTLEVDLINSDNYKGNRRVKMHGHRHNVNHWGDGYVGIRVAAPQGFRLGYFLTGDLRVYDQLKMSMEAHWDSIYDSDRQHATGLGLLSFFWEATGEDSYRKALDSYLDYQAAQFSKFGHIHNGTWRFRKDQDRILGDKPLSGSPIDFFFQNFGSAYSLMELADLTGRTDLVEALIQLAMDTVKQSSWGWESKYSHYRLMAFAYRHSGDRTFLQYAYDGVKGLQVFSDRRTWSWRPATGRFDDKLSMLAWTGQGLPYLMKAIELRKDDPVSSFNAPEYVKMPDDKTMASVQVDGNSSRAADGDIQRFEWWVDGDMLSAAPADTLRLPAGRHRIELRVIDTKGRKSMSEKSVAVWRPGVIARLCFTENPFGFMPKRIYKDEYGYGYLPGTNIHWTSEPRRYGGTECKEVYIYGTVQVKTGPGVYTVEMGGKDFWTMRDIKICRIVLTSIYVSFPLVGNLSSRRLRTSRSDRWVVVHILLQTIVSKYQS
ncbi:MAG: hypothetical protein HY758_08285 [Nitrospirae bacterium]|nr:hypothetical protein [Nitrospirota bacterium]